MQDAWRAYLEMALGLTEAPRKRAQQVAGDLVSRGGATAAQLQGLVEDLMSTGMANREALTTIVRYEVDRALGLVGLATNDEVADLTARVRDLERQLREAQAGAGAAASGVTAAGAEIGGDRVNRPAPLPGRAAKKTVAKKAVKATPNAMPAAATSPRKAADEAPAADLATTADVAEAADVAVKKAAARKAATRKASAPGPVGAEAAPAKKTARAAKAVKAGPVGSEVVPDAGPSGSTTEAGPVGAEAVSAPARKAARKAAAPTPAVPRKAPAKRAPARRTTTPEARQ